MRAFVVPALVGILAIVGLVGFAVLSGGDDEVLESADEVTSLTTSTAPTTTTTTTTTVPATTPPSTIDVTVDEEASDEPEVALPPELTTDVEIAQLGETFVRYRIRSSEPTAYTAEVQLDGEVVSTDSGVLAADETKTVRVDGLEPGTVYTANATLTGPPAVQSSDVVFRTLGAVEDPAQDELTDQVEMINLRVTDLQHNQFQFDYLSNVCANGTFLITDQESGEVVGSNNGHPNGCVAKHLGVPGLWTPPLTPETTYVVLVTLEANGDFRGRQYGNTTTESLVVTTPPRPTPNNPADRTVPAVEFIDVTQMETDSSSVRIDFATSVCANVSFVVREIGGDEVGRHDGFPRGCATQHSAIPGLWTDALEPGTPYVVLLTAEADGQGVGDGNVASESITVRTAPFVAPPEDPPEETSITGFETRPDGDRVGAQIDTNVCSTVTVTTFEQAGEQIDSVSSSPGECSTTHEVELGRSTSGRTVVVVTAEGDERVPGEPNRATSTRVIDQ